MKNPFLPEFTNLNTISACLQKKQEISNQGQIAQLKKQIQSASKELKKELGQELNLQRKFLQEAADQKIQEIQAKLEADNFLEFDPTFYSQESLNQEKNGFLHPISIITQEIVDILSKIGFQVFESSQIKTQYDNFTSVGTPAYHPARTMQDTFFLEQKDELKENYVMKTQVTANLKAFAKENKPPFKVIFPGLAFRAENIDATHDINFHQLDIWMIEKQTSIGELIDLINYFIQEFFQEPGMKFRLRPSYFPFTEPSLEGDIYCPWFKDGQWIEILGAGPIHRQVIKNIGLDTEEWQGLAVGFGLTRLAQLKFRITGLGQFYNGHVDFLRGYSF